MRALLAERELSTMPQPVDPPSSEEIEAMRERHPAVAEKDYDLHAVPA